MEKCSVGHYLEENSTTSTQVECSQGNFVNCSELGEEERELLILRTKCVNFENICNQHMYAFLSIFEDRQRVCCDPFRKHKKNVYKGLNTVSLPFSKKYKQKVELVPGTKICVSCRKAVYSTFLQDNEKESNLSDTDYEPDDFLSKNEVISKLNESCELMECSPIKVKKRKLDERAIYLENKADRIADRFQNMAKKALNIESSSKDKESKNKQNCSDCTSLMCKLKEKFKKSKIDDQIQILTLVPESWSILQTVNFF